MLIRLENTSVIPHYYLSTTVKENSHMDVVREGLVFLLLSVIGYLSKDLNRSRYHKMYTSD